MPPIDLMPPIWGNRYPRADFKCLGSQEVYRGILCIKPIFMTKSIWIPNLAIAYFIFDLPDATQDVLIVNGQSKAVTPKAFGPLREHAQRLHAIVKIVLDSDGQLHIAGDHA